MGGQPGFFDVEERLKELSAKGDELVRLKHGPCDAAANAGSGQWHGDQCLLGRGASPA